jgi:hypothetical protein
MCRRSSRARRKPVGRTVARSRIADADRGLAFGGFSVDAQPFEEHRRNPISGAIWAMSGGRPSSCRRSASWLPGARRDVPASSRSWSRIRPSSRGPNPFSSNSRPSPSTNSCRGLVAQSPHRPSARSLTHRRVKRPVNSQRPWGVRAAYVEIATNVS